MSEKFATVQGDNHSPKMPLVRHDIPLMEESENAVSRMKSGLVTSSKSQLASRPRAVLGDLLNNKMVSQLNCNVKAEATEDFKKPTVLPVRAVKKASEDNTNASIQILSDQVKSVVVVQDELPTSFSSHSASIQEIDTEIDNPQLVSCYVKDIYKYLLEIEARTPIKANYMEGYKIKASMRTILIDWLIEVHGRFKLLQETLFLTVAVMDRFLQVDSSISRPELQLVGLTAMFVASKFEEMYAPEIHDFVYMSDKAYTKKEILRMEYRILKAIDFSLGRPLPLHFLRRYTKAASHVSDDVDVLHHTLSKYLIELTLPEYDFCHYPPSQLAAAALCLSLRILDENETPMTVLWNESLVFYSGFTSQALQPLIEKLCALIVKSESSKQQAVRKKYAASKFYNISTIHHLKSAFVNVFANMALKNAD